jgi:hypothetical protein
MPHPNHPTPTTHTLPGGETLTLDHTTIPDPETGHPIPTATLRLPTWRLHELATALKLWSRIHTMITTEAHHLPAETDLADHLHQAAHQLTQPRH